MRGPRAAALATLAAVVAAAGLAGCTESDTTEAVAIEVWFHEEDGPARDVLEAQALRFNEQSDDVTVLLRVLPGGDHTDQLVEAHEAGDLPALFDVDPAAVGERLPVEALAPLADLLGPAVTDDLVTEVADAGRFGQDLRAVPAALDTVVLVADRRALRNASVAVPGGFDQPWEGPEFTRALRRLTEQGTGPALELGPLDDPHLLERMATLARVHGGPLLTGPGDPPAAVQMDGPGAVQALAAAQGWLAAGWARVDGPGAADPGEGGTGDGDVGDDEGAGGDGNGDGVGREHRPPLVLGTTADLAAADAGAGRRFLALPPPDLGGGSTTVSFGHAWAIPAGHPDAGAAARFLRFLLRPEEVVRTVDAAGGFPVSASALERLPRFAPDGPGWVVRQALLGGAARPVEAAAASTLVRSAVAEVAADVLVDGAPARARLEEQSARLASALSP